MKVLAIGNGTGSKFYRLVPGLKSLQSRGHFVMMADGNDRNLAERIDWADVVIFQMVFSPQYFDYAKTKGKRIIFEIDDLTHEVPKTHYAYKELSGWNRYKWLWHTFRAVHKADGFICTNVALAEAYGLPWRKTLVFPNYLDLPHWLKPVRRNQGPHVRVLWAGSTSHTADLDWVRPIMDEILAKYPQVKFIYVGHGGIPSDDLHARFVFGEDIFEGMPLDRRESMLGVPANTWPYVLSGMLADIAIAPLTKEKFNRYKSQCKYLEYAVNAIPGVYAAHHYTDVRDGVTGFLADTKEEWVDALSKLVEDQRMRREMGDRAREVVVNDFDIRHDIEDWEKFVLGR